MIDMVELIEKEIDFRASFEKEQTRLSNKYGITKEHAGCFMCNGGVDEYICEQYNGGCKELKVCKSIERVRLHYEKQRVMSNLW